MYLSFCDIYITSCFRILRSHISFFPYLIKPTDRRVAARERLQRAEEEAGRERDRDEGGDEESYSRVSRDPSCKDDDVIGKRNTRCVLKKGPLYPYNKREPRGAFLQTLESWPIFSWSLSLFFLGVRSYFFLESTSKMIDFIQSEAFYG